MKILLCNANGPPTTANNGLLLNRNIVKLSFTRTRAWYLFVKDHRPVTKTTKKIKFSVLCFLICLSSSCILCAQCCQCLWIVHSWLPLRFSQTFISDIFITVKYNSEPVNLNDFWQFNIESIKIQRHYLKKNDVNGQYGYN
jgi:hypothetical protein